MPAATASRSFILLTPLLGPQYPINQVDKTVGDSGKFLAHGELRGGRNNVIPIRGRADSGNGGWSGNRNRGGAGCRRGYSEIVERERGLISHNHGLERRKRNRALRPRERQEERGDQEDRK